MQYKEDNVDKSEITSVVHSLDSGLGNDGQSNTASNMQFKEFENKLSHKVRPVDIQGESTKMKALRARLPVSDEEFPSIISQKNPQRTSLVRSQCIDNAAASNQLRASNWKPDVPPELRSPEIFMPPKDDFLLNDAALHENSKSAFSKGMK